MFQFRNYIIEQDGEYNISLYRIEPVEIREGNEFGQGWKGRGKPSGKFKDEKVHQGYFSTFPGAFESMAGKVMKDLRVEGDAPDIEKLSLVLKELMALSTEMKKVELPKEPEA
jgi:hypothetical protein